MKSVVLLMLLSLTLGAENKGNLKLELNLIDGSVLMCETSEKSIKVKFQGNVVDVNFDVISLMTFDKKKSVYCLFKNKDKVNAELVGDELQVTSLLGEMKIPFTKLKSLSLIDHRSIDVFVIKGKVNGCRTETQFVKDLPKSLQKKYTRVTRTANTSSSIVSRARTAPWLYFIRGEKETPRIFVENGMKYYPIWGTWRQKNNSGWKVWDHNKKYISGEASRMYPHWSTKVDYYVVPIKKLTKK